MLSERGLGKTCMYLPTQAPDRFAHGLLAAASYQASHIDVPDLHGIGNTGWMLLSRLCAKIGAPLSNQTYRAVVVAW